MDSQEIGWRCELDSYRLGQGVVIHVVAKKEATYWRPPEKQWSQACVRVAYLTLRHVTDFSPDFFDYKTRNTTHLICRGRLLLEQLHRQRDPKTQEKTVNLDN
jgi:hypothetical protein